MTASRWFARRYSDRRSVPHRLTEVERRVLETIATLGDVSMSSSIRNSFRGLNIQTSTRGGKESKS